MKQIKSAFCLENADLIFLLKHRFYRGDFMLKFADAHCDTITRLTSLEMALGCLEAAEGHLDFPRLCQRVKLQFMAFFLHQATPEQAWQHLRRLSRSIRLLTRRCRISAMPFPPLPLRTSEPKNQSASAQA